jgi:hypothetical protein
MGDYLQTMEPQLVNTLYVTIVRQGEPGGPAVVLTNGYEVDPEAFDPTTNLEKARTDNHLPADAFYVGFMNLGRPLHEEPFPEDEDQAPRYVWIHAPDEDWERASDLIADLEAGIRE